MKTKHQENIIVKKLLTEGKVSRNWAIQNYISRLSTIICDLNKAGWSIKGGYVKENGGKNYYYRVEKAPYRQVVYKVEGREPFVVNERI